MRRNHFAAVLAGLAAVALVASDASAVYHPTLGRFLQRDPVGYADGMGLHEYVGGAPLQEVDPQGMTALLPPDVFGGDSYLGGPLDTLLSGEIPHPGYVSEAATIDALAALAKAIGKSNLPPPRSGAAFATSYAYCCACVKVAGKKQDGADRYAQDHSESARLGHDSEQSEQWMQERGWRTVAGTTLARVWIEPASGPCADLIFQGRGEHERVHWEERNQIMDDARRGRGRATTEWGKQRRDPQSRAAGEGQATAAERTFYQEFIDACASKFGVGRPSIAI